MGSLADIPLSILACLCPNCAHGSKCPGVLKISSGGGGISCGAYKPTPSRKSKLSVRQIMSLPDREPCTDCASRKGTVPNETPHTLADFAMCVRENQPFLCHGEGSSRICAGWLRAAKAKIAADKDTTP